MKNPFHIAWEAVQGLFYQWKYRKRIRTAAVEEIPDTLDRGFLYVLGSGQPWSVALLCPCGCGETIHLSLLNYDSPSWTLRVERGGIPTLSPSVWRTKGCRSHFFLRRGTVVWSASRMS
jgi:hypothetical protein